MTPTRFRNFALALAALLAACNGDGTQPPPNLEAPTGLAVQATSPNTAHMSWNAVSGAVSYTIQRAQGASGGTFETIGSSATTSFDDSGLNADTQYRYRVQAVSGNAQSAYSTEASVTTPPAIVPTVEITTDITTNTTWTPDKIYLLKGFIHVANGATLTILPGTKVVGDFNTVGSSLFVLRGARIIAEGTPQSPIVFTSSRATGQRQAGDWGGLILVGNGIINRGSPVILEGSGTGANNPAVDYSGGNNNSDNSGSLSYVRVEFAGYAPAQDTELNSFTFAAVGSATRCDHLESLNGLDDAFEFFGGAVNCLYLVSYNSGDDHFDIAEGFIGRIQFAIAYQTRTVVPRPLAGNISSDPQGIENDGCNGSNCLSGQTSQPYTVPMIANFTLVGPPATVTNSAGNIGLMLRRGTAGIYVNGVVARWSRAGISLRDQTTLDRIADNNLILQSILVTETPVIFQPQTGTTVQGTVDLQANAIEDARTTTGSSLFLAVPDAEPANGAALDFAPTGTSPAATGGLAAFSGPIATKAAGVVSATAYRGAAGTTTAKWWQGWTYFAVN